MYTQMVSNKNVHGEVLIAKHVNSLPFQQPNVWFQHPRVLPPSAKLRPKCKILFKWRKLEITEMLKQTYVLTCLSAWSLSVFKSRSRFSSKALAWIFKRNCHQGNHYDQIGLMKLITFISWIRLKTLMIILTNHFNGKYKSLMSFPHCAIKPMRFHWLQ